MKPPRNICTSILWLQVLCRPVSAQDDDSPQSITEIRTDVVYVSQADLTSLAVSRHHFSRISKRNSSAPTGCGPSLALCDEQDPTRIESPWSGVSSPFPQCYDPALYVCSDNFLCPTWAPRLPGIYACDTRPRGASISNTISPVPTPVYYPTGTAAGNNNTCEIGLLSCDVQDPTRKEAPWHGVEASFPQCFNASLHVCSENFLCPVRYPKIPGQYACGPNLPTMPPLGTTSLPSLSGSLLLPSDSLAFGTSSDLSAPVSSSISTATGLASDSRVATDTLGSSTDLSTTLTTSPTGTTTVLTTTTAESLSTPVSSTTSSSLLKEVIIGGTSYILPLSTTTIIQPNGPPVVLGPSNVAMGSTTVQLNSGTDLRQFTYDGVTVTIVPGVPGGSSTTLPATFTTRTSEVSSTTVPGSFIVIGSSSIAFPSTPTTLSESNGETVVLGPSGIWVGSDVISIASFTTPRVITTHGLTFTLNPGGPPAIKTSTSKPPLIGFGGSAFGFPTAPTTLVDSSGGTVVFLPGGIILGTNSYTFPYPTFTATSTVTIESRTFTFAPGGLITPPPKPPIFFLNGYPFSQETGTRTITEPGGAVLKIGFSDIFSGTETFPFPLPCSTLAIHDIVLWIPCLTSEEISTSSEPPSTGALPTFAAWPTDFSMSSDDAAATSSGTATTGTHIVHTTTSKDSHGTSHPFAFWVPQLPCFLCGCFFCPPHGRGWSLFGFILPGIYPPPPPGILPPGFSGNLPWITIGWDGNPTYGSEGNNPTSAKDSASTATSTSTPTSTSTSTSTSSCSTITATDCTHYVSFGLSTDGSTTASSTSTSCSTVTACSASGHTSTTTTVASCTITSACSTSISCPSLFRRQAQPSACKTKTECAPEATGATCPGSTTKYIIYPAGENVVGTVEDIFKNEFKVSSDDIYTSRSKYLKKTFFWQVPLTGAQAAKLRSDISIANLYAACTSGCYDPSGYLDSSPPALKLRSTVSQETEYNTTLVKSSTFDYFQKRDQGVAYQPLAPDELVHISTPKDVEIDAQKHKYVFDSSAGYGTRVYIVDTGANLDIPQEFPTNKMFLTPYWIQAGPDRHNRNDSGLVPNANPGGKGWVANGISVGHGTAMLSKVCGHKYGVAKRTQSVIVRCPAPINPECFLDALNKILDDVADVPIWSDNGVVVSMSLYWEEQFIKEKIGLAWVTNIRLALQKLAALGATLVVGSGNNGATKIEGWPASFAKTTLPKDEQVPSLIVVGGTYSNGKKATKLKMDIPPTSNTDPNVPMVWAPGFEIQVANARYNLLTPEGQFDGPYREGSGSSEAAASVAGLCAYFLGLTSIHQQLRPISGSGIDPDAKFENSMAVRNYVYGKVIQRPAPANVETVWNGQLLSKELDKPAQCPAVFEKRQGGVPDDSSCSRPIDSMASIAPSSSLASPATKTETSLAQVTITPTEPTIPPSTVLPTDMPRFQSFVTAKDHSCLSTNTATRCAPGPDLEHNQLACVIQTACLSWTSFKTIAVAPTATPAKSPDIMFGYTKGVGDCFNCPNWAEFQWYPGNAAIDYPLPAPSESAAIKPLTELFGHRKLNNTDPSDVEVINSDQHFPRAEKVSLGTRVNALNCLFHPDQHDGDHLVTDKYFKGLDDSDIVGTWWCSPSMTYDASTASKMGGCYKRYLGEVHNTETKSSRYVLFFCRSETQGWPVAQ